LRYYPGINSHIQKPIKDNVMKKVIVYAACFLITFSAIAAAPGSKLIQRFSETFPNAKDVKWRDDTNGYFVSFTQNGNYNKAFYSKNGEFVYSLKYFYGEQLPTNILMSLNEKFGQAKILGVTEVTTQNGTVYNVKLSKEDKLYCMNISTDGAIANQEVYATVGADTYTGK
jgi:hypothetical protein